MNNKLIHIIIAYIFHIISIVMSIEMMKQDCNQLLITFIVMAIVYLIYWFIYNRKSYMPWIVYFNFLVGAVTQIILNNNGVVPEDGGMFSGIGQFFYVVLVVVHAAIVGIMNLILFMIDKKRKN